MKMYECEEIILDNEPDISPEPTMIGQYADMPETAPLSRREREHAGRPVLKTFSHRALVFTGSLGLTMAFFLVLPLMQTLTKPPQTDLTLQSVDTAYVPPPPQVEEEPEPEPEPQEEPPELQEEAPPLDLSQMELALNPGAGIGSEGWMGADFSVKLGGTANGSGNEVDALFSLADLDQPPRIIYQPGPVLSAAMRKRTPGKVYILFIVDKTGKVVNPIVQKSSDQIFDQAALNAVKQWKFEPGKRNGTGVRFRMRVPIAFPKG